MEKIKVVGGNKLHGKVKIKGSKNSVLPILAASVLASEGISVIRDVPRLSDVDKLITIINYLGVKTKWIGDHDLEIDATNVTRVSADLECAGEMRASILLLGPLLARFGEAEINQPGGCAIGVRPIDLHLKGLEYLGAKFDSKYGVVKGNAHGLKGEKIYLDFPSVGATQNLMMAAAISEGVTIIENVAEEPEIIDLANYINKMGGRVSGAGTNVIRITGVPVLRGVRHRVISDRIEAGTYMICAAAAGGDIILENVILDHLKPIVAKLRESGVHIMESGDDNVRVISEGAKFCKGLYIKTMPYPGFPTDMQSQMLAFLLCSKGRSYVTETIFENRFQHIDEFRKMNGDLILAGNTVALNGVDEIYGSNVLATDLRAGAALIIAGLIASGTTYIGNIHFVDRGYDGIVDNLKNLGAEIERVEI